MNPERIQPWSPSGTRTQDSPAPADIHACGVDIVRGWMEQDGFRILGVCRLPRYNPQIIAERHGQLCHVIVRTGIHPGEGVLDNEEGLCCVEHAARCSALCYFAGVTLVGAAEETESDAGFFVSCSGLRVLTTPEHIGAGS
jgi:hypothetical protein